MPTGGYASEEASRGRERNQLIKLDSTGLPVSYRASFANRVPFLGFRFDAGILIFKLDRDSITGAERVQSTGYAAHELPNALPLFNDK